MTLRSRSGPGSADQVGRDRVPVSAPVAGHRQPHAGVAAARLAQDCIKSVEVLEYPELGMEAVWKIEVEDFPAFIVVDDKGNDFFTDPSGAVTVPISGLRVRSKE